MREQGQPLSTLWPFLVGYYRPMGWEWCGSSRSYTLPLTHLPCGIDSSRIRPAVPQDAATLQALYEAWVRPYRLAEARRLSWWQERLDAKTGLPHYFYLYEDPAPRGYLCLQLTEPAWVHELAWLAPEAYRALLGVVQRHQSQLSQIRWGAPPDDPLWHYAAHWDVQVAWKPPLSARVVDLPAALALLQPNEALAGRCTVRVRDRLAPWNDGCWRIEVEAGTVRAERTVEAPPLTCDIGAWSQLFVGDPDAAALRRAGRIAVADERAYALLHALCPRSLVWSP
jgi:predicted acetyltransferase